MNCPSRFLSIVLGFCLFLAVAGCSSPQEPLLRIASNVWPGYEILFLGRDLEYFDPEQIRLVEVPSATACIQALASGNAEGAMLTLDEVITARTEGLNLQIIAVLDVSLGADVLITKPHISTLADLKGQRIGVEQSAVGAVMLDAILKASGLGVNDITIVYMTVNHHKSAFEQDKVDALITFEPVRTLLLKQGANQLFDSAMIPGRIIDVLAVMPRAVENNPETLAELVASHFNAREYWQQYPDKASQILAKRLQLPPAEVADTYVGLELSDLKDNRRYLGGSNPSLQVSAEMLTEIMVNSGLINTKPNLSNLATDQFLPGD